MIITKAHSFVPVRPKYMRKKKWEAIKGNVITAKDINDVCDKFNGDKNSEL